MREARHILASVWLRSEFPSCPPTHEGNTSHFGLGLAEDWVLLMSTNAWVKHVTFCSRSSRGLSSPPSPPKHEGNTSHFGLGLAEYWVPLPVHQRMRETRHILTSVWSRIYHGGRYFITDYFTSWKTWDGHLKVREPAGRVSADCYVTSNYISSVVIDHIKPFGVKIMVNFSLAGLKVHVLRFWLYYSILFKLIVVTKTLVQFVPLTGHLKFTIIEPNTVFGVQHKLSTINPEY